MQSTLILYSWFSDSLLSNLSMIFWINRYTPLKMLFIYRNVRKYHCNIVLLWVIVTVWSLSLLMFLDLSTTSQHIFNTWFIPVIQFWYSSGSLSSMCVFKFSCACCFRYAIFLLMTDLFTCNVCAIFLPMAWLDSSSTFVSSPTYLLLHFGAQKLQFSTLDFWYCCIFTPGISWNYTLLVQKFALCISTH